MSKKLKDEEHMRGMAKLKGKRRERAESERDSGFSDASSEHMSAIDQTDPDEASCSVGSSGSGSQPSQLAAVVGGGALQGLSPMIIMNNVVLKQSGENPSSLKPWSFSPAVEMVQQPQVVFLQPMIPQKTAAVSKGPPSKRRLHKKYLPILKSYPKIAPHPGENPKKGSSTGSRSTSSSSSSQRDVGHSESSDAPAVATLPSSLPAAAPTHKASANSGDSSSLHGERQTSARSSESTDDCPDPTSRALAPSSRCVSASGTDNKLKRFCNTYNILSKSGLLDITLRTKELIRQNRRTQSELERLREHANLYVAALQTGDSAIWSRLQMSVMEEN
ncbi:CLOCK-interacting pacemaker [Misgurnus anguillicaudatus]|uniref:CLOCK-interacting pacemaker n=1 Tax=Misgurnus anguillicaudatus TaxID=75329 RepID=UPI003CCFD26C